MRLALNLRSDLAKLADAQLEDRLAATWRAYDAAEQDSRPANAPWQRTLKYSARGPIRHPWAYLFTSIMAIGNTMGFWLGQPFYPSLFGRDAMVQMHLNLCEIRDIHDEIERRKAARLGRKSS
jgi:hypothetical protein